MAITLEIIEALAMKPEIDVVIILGFLETKKSRDRVWRHGHDILPAVGLNRCRHKGPASRRGQVG